MRDRISHVFTDPGVTMGTVVWTDGSSYTGRFSSVMRRQILIWRGRRWFSGLWFNYGTPVVGLALALLFAKAYVNSGWLMLFIAGCVAASWAAVFAVDLVLHGKRTIRRDY